MWENYRVVNTHVDYCILGIIHERNHLRFLQILEWSWIFSCYYFLSFNYLDEKLALWIATAIWLYCSIFQTRKEIRLPDPAPSLKWNGTIHGVKANKAETCTGGKSADKHVHHTIWQHQNRKRKVDMRPGKTRMEWHWNVFLK